MELDKHKIAAHLYIKPIVDGYYIEEVDPYKTSYIWDPVKTKKAKNLKAIGVINAYSTYSYPTFFKPSVAEVIHAIPEQHLDSVIAFEIVEKPARAYWTADGLHGFKVCLYKLNEEGFKPWKFLKNLFNRVFIPNL